MDTSTRRRADLLTRYERVTELAMAFLALILVAARIGATRLIDNIVVVPKGIPVPADLRPLMAE